MPIYEYRCDACGELVEALQRVSDPPLRKCPACGGELSRLLSAPAFQFKGSGWYVTDYGKGGRKEPSQEKKEEGAGKGEAAAEKKSSGRAEENKTASGAKEPKKS